MQVSETDSAVALDNSQRRKTTEEKGLKTPQSNQNIDNSGLHVLKTHKRSNSSDDEKSKESHSVCSKQRIMNFE